MSAERLARLRALVEAIEPDLYVLSSMVPAGSDATDPNRQLLDFVLQETARQLAAIISEQATDQLTTLTSELAEVREGQHELLRMYEELRELYPHNCMCAARKERAQRELAAFDPFAPEPNHEDYVPSGDEW